MRYSEEINCMRKRLESNDMFKIVNVRLNNIKFPFKRTACQVYRVGYGKGRI